MGLRKKEGMQKYNFLAKEKNKNKKNEKYSRINRWMQIRGGR